MSHTTTLRALASTLVLFTIAGCFSLSRKSPTLEQYVLGGPPLPAGAVGPRDPAGVTIGLRRLDLAAYLATPEIIVRHGDHHIVTSEFHRWGEDLAQGISRSVARHLGAEAGVRAVDVAPWPVGSRFDYLVQLHVLRFEGSAFGNLPAADGEAHVAVVWEIIRQEDGAVLARGATDYRERNWQVSDYGGLVTRLNRGLNVLVGDLVACMNTVAPARVAAKAGSVAPALESVRATTCAPRSQ